MDNIINIDNSGTIIITIKLLLHSYVNEEEIYKIMKYCYDNYPRLKIGNIKDHYVIYKNISPDKIDDYLHLKKNISWYWLFLYLTNGKCVIIKKCDHKLMDGASIIFLFKNISYISKKMYGSSKNIINYGDDHKYITNTRIYKSGIISDLKKFKTISKYYNGTINDLYITLLSKYISSYNAIMLIMHKLPDYNLGNNILPIPYRIPKYENINIIFKKSKKINKIIKYLFLNKIKIDDILSSFCKVIGYQFLIDKMTNIVKHLSKKKPLIFTSNLNLSSEYLIFANTYAEHINVYTDYTYKNVNIIYILLITYMNNIILNISSNINDDIVPDIDIIRKNIDEIYNNIFE